MNKKLAAPGAGATSKVMKSQSNPSPHKHELCLYELLKAGLKGIHKVGKPSYVYGETCLPTTISQLGIRRGIKIDRERRPHTHRAGGKTFFTWYWLANHKEAVKALSLLNALRRNRGALALTDSESRLLLAKFPPRKQSAV